MCLFSAHAVFSNFGLNDPPASSTQSPTSANAFGFVVVVVVVVVADVDEAAAGGLSPRFTRNTAALSPSAITTSPAMIRTALPDDFRGGSGAG